MLKDVQIEGQLRYVVPTKKIGFLPPLGMLMVYDMYFCNFPVLPILKFLSEVFMYNYLYIHEVSLAFFYYLQGLQNILLDLGVMPTDWLF